jgi:hypothetical protein
VGEVMRIVLVLLGLMCFTANLRVGDKLAEAIVFGENTNSLWALFVAFLAGTIGCALGVIFHKN